MNINKRRLRFATIVPTDGYDWELRHMINDLRAELTVIPGYLGHIEDGKAIYLITTGREAQAAATRAARRSGFERAGSDSEEWFIADKDVHRPEFRRRAVFRKSYQTYR